jgi:hypothetical protein
MPDTSPAGVGKAPGPLPNFFVVGTAKSGSASLASFLDRHPDVCMCEAWEPNFFSSDQYYARGLDSYRSRYSHYDGERMIGEKSWRYSCSQTYPKALERMLGDIPSFKAIYVVRDPVKRALSMWRELRDAGQDAVPSDPNVALSTEGMIVDSCRYDRQIRRFEDAIGAENVRILFFEDMLDNPRAFYGEVCDFLQIERVSPRRRSTRTSHSARDPTARC